jgi:hypothetical protein
VGERHKHRQSHSKNVPRNEIFYSNVTKSEGAQFFSKGAVIQASNFWNSISFYTSCSFLGNFEPSMQTA